jgi:glutamyl-tRNA synthetase
MLARGHAYKCFATPQELDEMREAQKARGVSYPMRYDGRWRDRDPARPTPTRPIVIRLKAPRTGETVINDAVQGERHGRRTRSSTT